MSDRDDGGPAFPVLHDRTENFRLTNDHGGMRLRDWFAGQAIAGVAHHGTSALDKVNLAARAYGIADAMLIARKRP